MADDEEEFDTQWTSLPVCPSCGFEDQDWWDGLGHKNDGDDWEATCGNCEKEFKVTFCISYTFATDKIEVPVPH